MAQSTSDSTFLHDSHPITFEVNRCELNETDRQWIDQSLLPQLQAIGPRGILLGRAAASPEGPLWNNKRLSRGRRDAVVNYLLKHGYDPHRINFDLVDEEYGLLVEMMRERHDTAYVEVRDLVRAGAGNLIAIKAALQSRNHGRLWRRLLAEYFPHLRAVRILAYDFSIPKPRDLQFPPLSLLYRIEIPYVDPRPILLEDGFFPQADQPRLVRPELLAIRTNLLYDAWYQPQFGWAPGMNVQLEYFPRRGHLTYNAGFTFHNHRHWSDYQFFQVRDIDLETRWYFRRSGTFAGPYAGVDIHGSWYGIGFSKTKGWEGEGAGAGVTLGWTWPLTKSRRWRLEANLGFGYFSTRYDPYVYGNTLTGEEDGKYYYDYYGAVSLFRKRNHQFQWFGPTQAGLHLTYVLLYRRIQRRGAGFRRTEALRPSSGSHLLQEGVPQ